MNSACDVKQFYDSEFEADVMAAKQAAAFGSEMIVYKCGSHYHTAHKDRKLWGYNRGFKQTYCSACNQRMKAKTYKKHITRERHKYLVRKQKEA